MAYYVVYKSNIHKRMLQNGLTQHYVMIGVYNSEQALKMHGAIYYNRFNREEDATKDWDSHCRQMQKEWPLRAGMDVASAKKLLDICNDCVTIDGRHHTMRMDIPGEQKQLF
jgi:hypothetical protein